MLENFVVDYHNRIWDWNNSLLNALQTQTANNKSYSTHRLFNIHHWTSFKASVKNFECLLCLLHKLRNSANLIGPDTINSDNSQSLLCYDKWKDSTSRKVQNVLLICVTLVVPKLDLFYKVRRSEQATVPTWEVKNLGWREQVRSVNRKFQPSATSFIDKDSLEKALSLIKNILAKMIWQEVKRGAKRLKQAFYLKCVLLLKLVLLLIRHRELKLKLLS